MALDTYIRGVDSIELEFILTDEDGTVIDTDNLDDVQVEIMTSQKSIPENTVKWTGTITGGEVVVTDHAAGTIECYIEPTDTEDWPITRYYARVTKTETDVSFTSGKKYSASVADVFRLIVE